jgi:serine/threonine-protein kinase
VYSLGAILFEILAGEALHPRGDAALATTLTGPQVAPTTRAGDRQIPPELDIACFDALAEDAAKRPSARQLADRVQAYLDGDRDVERRRALAAEQLISARDALDHGGPEARATAVRRAGRALALDPESTEAAELVTSLMLEPPAKLPTELVASLKAEEQGFNRERSRATTLGSFTLFAFWAVIPFLEVKNWTSLLAFYGLVSLGTLNAWRISRTGRTPVAMTLVVLTLIALAFSRMLGPFILTPIIACAILIVVTAIPELDGRRWLVIGFSIAMVMLPLVLEWLGVIDQTFDIGSGFVRSASDIFAMRGDTIDKVSLIVAVVLFVVVSGQIAYVLNERRRGAQRQLHIQAWHLRQLLPRSWMTKPGSKS